MINVGIIEYLTLVKNNGKKFDIKAIKYFGWGELKDISIIIRDFELNNNQDGKLFHCIGKDFVPSYSYNLGNNLYQCVAENPCGLVILEDATTLGFNDKKYCGVYMSTVDMNKKIKNFLINKFNIAKSFF